MTGRRFEHDANFAAMVDRKRRARMDSVDALPKEMRALVHEYGYAVVNTLMNVGVKKPNQIRHVVETILNEFSPTRGSYSQQGVRVAVVRADEHAGEKSP